MRRGLKRLGIAISAGLFLATSAFLLSPELLSIERPVPTGAHADSIVVLGGIPGSRAEQAAELFQQQLAPHVLVSGTGDCFNNKAVLLRHQIPETAIHLECDSKTTRENAKFSVQILREQRARNVIIVTSWYHSRRALHCFQHFAPEIHFYSMPSHEHLTRWPFHWKGESEYVVSEYVKTVGYIFRWGILPF